MRKLLQMMWLGCMFAIPVSGLAQEPQRPPVLFPQEKWEVSFDNYMSLRDGNDDYRNLTREVSIVRNGNDLYIEGLFAEVPDAWVKCTLNGQEVIFEENQVLDIVDDQPVYFHWGSAEYAFNSGNTYAEADIKFQYSSNPEYSTTFTLSDDGETITAYMNQLGNPSAFWYDGKSDGNLQFSDGWYWKGPGDSDYEKVGEGFPEVDFMVNMVFRKVNDEGNSMTTKQIRL